MKWLKAAIWLNVAMAILFGGVTIAARVAPEYWPRPHFNEERSSKIQAQIETSSDAEYLKKMALAVLAERDTIEKYSFLGFSTTFELVASISLITASFSLLGLVFLIKYRNSMNTPAQRHVVLNSFRKRTRKKRRAG